MSANDWSRVERPRQPMPADVRAALEHRGLMAKYRQRPPYQQNEIWAGWRAPRVPRRGRNGWIRCWTN